MNQKRQRPAAHYTDGEPCRATLFDKAATQLCGMPPDALAGRDTANVYAVLSALLGGARVELDGTLKSSSYEGVSRAQLQCSRVGAFNYVQRGRELIDEIVAGKEKGAM